jgi:hypothetical protein
LAIADDGRIALHESAAGTPDRISMWAAGARVVEREVDHGGTQRAIAWLPDGGLVASERAETGEDRLLALSPALETLWAFPLSYPCAATVSRSGEVIVAGSWEQGAVLRRQR